MPEGDTIWRTATTLRRWIGGRSVTAARSVVPGVDATLLIGTTVEEVEARGKHLLLRFSGDLVVHTHMRMTGSWHVYPSGERWRKPAQQARLVLETGARLAVCFNAPVVELLTTGGERAHGSLRRLGPDVLHPETLDPAVVAARARARALASPTAGELLLDQQVVSGIGNIYRCESLFLCGVHPRVASTALGDGRLDRLVATASRLMAAGARMPGATRSFAGGPSVTRPASSGGPSFAGGVSVAGGVSRAGGPSLAGPASSVGPGRPWVYRRSGLPCRRCGTTVARELLGAQPRSVYWCPTCQPAP